jgi:hypothetical protein
MPRKTAPKSVPTKLHRERINRRKLEYLMRHFEGVVKPLIAARGDARHEDGKDTTPKVLCERYLVRCDDQGFLNVTYRQAGRGRWHAEQSVSLQAMFRQIRHTIAAEFYYDIDVVNCHVVILCSKLDDEDFDEDAYSAIAAYAAEPEVHRRALMDAAGCDRDTAKRVYLSKLNGGCQAYSAALKAIADRGGQVPEHLVMFSRQMNAIHTHYAKAAQAGDRRGDYEAMVEKRRSTGRDYNHEAAWLNLLMLEKEAAVLEVIWQALDRPLDCVLCFDGIMVDKRTDVRKKQLRKLEKAAFRATGVDIRLKVKAMDEGIELPEGWEATLDEEPEDTYFRDFATMLRSRTEFREAEIDDWAMRNIVCLSLSGRGRFAIRDIQGVGDGNWYEEYQTWSEQKMKDVEETLDRNCCVLRNDPSNGHKYHFDDMRGKPNTLAMYLRHRLFRANRLDTKTGIMCVPYLHDAPKLPHYLNSWGGFPLQRVVVSNPMDFEAGPLMAHWKNHFFREPQELPHFLASIADMVQNPGVKPTNCVRVFYSTEGGTGKGCTSQFMTRLLGTRSTIIIKDTEKFLKDSFGSEYCGRVLRIFEELPTGSRYQHNIDKLKEVWEAKRERKRELHKTGVEQPSFSREWPFTNNLPTWITAGAVARRVTLHHIKNDKANVAGGYWKHLWGLLDNQAFMAGAFQYFSTYKYDPALIRTACNTQVKRDIIQQSAPSAVKFLISAIESGTLNLCRVQLNQVANDHLPEGTIVVGAAALGNLYRDYCSDSNITWYRTTLATQLGRAIGLPRAEQAKLADGSNTRVYRIDPALAEQKLRDLFKDPSFTIPRPPSE